MQKKDSPCFPTGIKLKLKDVTRINISRKIAVYTVNNAVIKKENGIVFNIADWHNLWIFKTLNQRIYKFFIATILLDIYQTCTKFEGKSNGTNFKYFGMHYSTDF